MIAPADWMSDPAVLALLAAGAACALIYGVALNPAAPGPARTATKTAATLALAGAALAGGGSGFLVAALLASALGDMLLAAPGQRRFLVGVVAFAAAHGCYIPLFLEAGAFSAEPGALRWAVIAVVASLGAFVLFGLLWSRIGALRAPLSAYFAIICAMAAAAVALPPSGPAALAMAGALAFVASDMILGVELFRLGPDDPRRRLSGPAVWCLYWGGQALLLAGGLGLSAAGPVPG